MRPGTIATLAGTCGLGLMLAVPSAGAAAPSGAAEIAHLNRQRAGAGLPTVTEVRAWSADCAKHMDYVRLNGGLLTHSETPGQPGYTAGGARAGTTSVLTTAGSAFTSSGRNQFEHAPIHLMQMLDPWMRRSGAADGCLTTLRDVNRTFSSPTTFSYPPNHGAAAARETAREDPFVPGDAVGLPQGTVTGPHLYFFAAGPNGSYFSYRGHFTSATMTGPKGPVAIRTVDADTPVPGGGPGTIGSYLPPGGIIIPVAPLDVGSRYRVAVRFAPQPPLRPLSRTWSFTAVAPGASTRKRCTITTRKLRRGGDVRGTCRYVGGRISVWVAPARRGTGGKARTVRARIAAHGRWTVKTARRTRAGRYTVTVTQSGQRLARRTVRVR